MATDLTTCKVINKDDNSFMTLCTEWLKDSDSSFKIIVLLADSNFLEGEMKLNDVAVFAKNLSKTITEYLDLTRNILSDKGESGIEFVLKNSKLRWKKGPWNHGMIDVNPAHSNQVFPHLIEMLLTRHKDLEIKVNKLKTENEELNNNKREINDKLEEIIDWKNRFENDLYARFIVILNSKKEKIRELECEIENKIGRLKKPSVYEDETDNNESSETEDDRESKNQSGVKKLNFFSRISASNMKEEKLLKRQISDSDDKMTDSDYEDDKKSKKNCVKYLNDSKIIENTNESEKPSTSNANVADKSSISLSRPNISRLNTMSEESEEDIFS